MHPAHDVQITGFEIDKQSVDRSAFCAFLVTAPVAEAQENVYGKGPREMQDLVAQ